MSNDVQRPERSLQRLVSPFWWVRGWGKAAFLANEKAEALNIWVPNELSIRKFKSRLARWEKARKRANESSSGTTRANQTQPEKMQP